MKDFHKLDVWQRSHQLTLAVYHATQAFPREEMYGLISQLRRAAASVPANLAEGCGRVGANELARFVTIAMGSASELEYHIILAHDLGYLSEETFHELMSETSGVKRMLTGFFNTLKANSQKPTADSQKPIATSEREVQHTTLENL